MELIWLVPALPLLGFALLLVFGRRLGDPLAGWLATAAVAGSFAISVKLWTDLLALPAEERVLTQKLFTWIPAGSFTVDIGFLADPLSITMCLFVTGIGALIHLYSIGYMRDDPNFPKFFVYLNLFVASMLLLVLGDNLLLTFLGWEGVGVCSYFLISFWFTDKANATAGKKAFVTNRIGDVGFMVGSFLVWVTVGSLDYLDIRAATPTIAAGTATAIALLFFVGAVGKSAQLPLFVWLPDAMAGPTPVSALIHAATMVTAGVYLLTRLSPIMELAGWANDVVAWVGALTALVAATIAVAQNDIKKVLAYSTVSQLGFMFLAVGTQTYVAGVFHMVTHAFFKALLFLGSGSVILAMAHEQDMRRYGNLRKYLPITFITFVIGWLAIAGVPPLSGFWSKDEILAGAYNAGSAGPVLWVIAAVAALLTAFYMTRQVVMTFFGTERWRETAPVVSGGSEALAQGDDAATQEPDVAVDPHAEEHLTPEHTPRESPWTMTLPLVVLAVFAVLAGVVNLPFAEDLHFLGNWLEPSISGERALPGASTLWVLAIIAIAIALGGIYFGWQVYQRRKVAAERFEPAVLANGWYIDQTYARIVDGPGRAAFQGVADVDVEVVDGAVNGVARLWMWVGSKLRITQTGLIRSYALGLGVGVLLLMAFIVTRMNL